MPRIKSQIKKIAKEFDLKYETKWFAYLWISKRQEILLEYLGNCPDPIYQKYGKTAEHRMKNLDKFINSKDFKECVKRFGGQVLEKKSFEKNKKLFKKIKNKKIKSELFNFHKKIKNKFKKVDQIALLTKTNIKKEKYWLKKYILRHEWIHILLYKNKVNFQKINKKYWAYDEGLNEFLGAYLDGKLNKLERFRDKENYPLEKKNWIHSIKFRELFKNKKTPKERKEVIFNLIKRLKK